jgi:GTP-binding protein
LSISAVTGEGVKEMLRSIAEMLASLPKEEHVMPEVKVFRPAEEGKACPEPGRKAFTITWEDNAWRVRGAEVERVVAMTNWDLDEAVQRFQRLAEAMGLKAALREAGVQPGDTVRIGEVELEWQ